MKVLELPKYLTIRIGGIIEGIENIRLLINLISKYNLARDTAYKYIIQEFSDLKTFLAKKYGKVIKKYEDWKKLSDRFEKTIAGHLYHIAYEKLSNKKYAEAVSLEVYSTLKSLNCLRDKLRQLGEYRLVNELPNDNEIEFKIWKHVTCIGNTDKSDRGNRNIKLFDDRTLRITYLTREYIYGKWSVHSRKYKEIIYDLISNIENGNYIPYTAKVVLKNEYIGNEVLPVEIHITLPFEYVMKFEKIVQHNVTNYPMDKITGHDVNVDRINDVIVNVKNLQIVTHRTFWFDEVNIKNISHDYIWNKIVLKITESIGWNVGNKSFIHVFEDYELIGDWKLLDQLKNKSLKNSESNWRKYSFRSSVIEKYGIELYKYGLPLPKLINPSFTSKLAEETCHFFGLDKHTMSTYYITVFYILEQEINNKNHQ